MEQSATRRGKIEIELSTSRPIASQPLSPSSRKNGIHVMLAMTLTNFTIPMMSVSKSHNVCAICRASIKPLVCIGDD